MEPELKKIGLVLTNVNITDITDESGYIDAIGQKSASQAIQQARADVADEVKQGEIRVADANREKEVEVANATKLKSIGTREAQREQAVRIADLEKEQIIGEQAATFERDMQIKHAEQEMRLSVADANSKAVDGENIPKRRLPSRKRRCLPNGLTRTNGVNRVNAKPKQRCWKYKTGRWPKRPWPKRNASKPRSVPRSRHLRNPRRHALLSTVRPKQRNVGSKPKVPQPPFMRKSKPKPAVNTKFWPKRATDSGNSSMLAVERRKRSS